MKKKIVLKLVQVSEEDGAVCKGCYYNNTRASRHGVCGPVDAKRSSKCESVGRGMGWIWVHK
jgi:hypothetical protein